MSSVSVIVPCYNYGSFLPDAIHSLIGGKTCRGQAPPQSFQDFEVIIIDDASKDNTAEVAADLSLLDHRVTFFTLFKNSGTAAALNAGIRAASGEHIYILSADDLIEPWTLELMHQESLAHPHRVCYGDLKIITGGSVVKDWPLTGYSLEKVITKNPIPAAGVMYPKRCWEEVGGYPGVMRWGREGWAFNIACATRGWPGHHVGTFCGYLYRWDGQNRSGKTAGRSPQTLPPRCKTWADFYKCQLAELYPELYKERNMPGCCGDPIPQASSSPNTARVTKTIPSLPGKNGFSIVEYVGPSMLDQTFMVGVTAYMFGAKKVGYVSKDHLPYILGMRGKQKEPLFVEVVPPPPPAPKPTPKAPPKPAPEPEPVAQEAKIEPEEPKGLDKKNEPEPIAPNATGAAITLAEAHGLSISQIAGTGTDGRVLKSDVQDYIAMAEDTGIAPWIESE